MARLRKYNSVEDMQQGIDKYFIDCDEKGEPYTITGLAMALGFESRKSLLNYEGYIDADDIRFLPTIKAAKNKVEDSIERGLLSGKYNSTGSIFNLKNNFDWRDKTEVETSGENKLDVNIKVMK